MTCDRVAIWRVRITRLCPYDVLHSMEVQSGWCRHDAVAVNCDCWDLGSGCGLILGRQAAWRPGSIGMVSSSWLAALCKQLLCLTVIARYLGSDCGLKFGRQAAWRPGSIGMVSSSWLAALCKQSLFSDCEVWARVAGCRQTARCRPRHCFKCADRVLCARRHTQQNSCRWQGLLFLLVFGLPPLVRSDVHAGGARQCRNLQFFGRLVRREGVTAASAAVQKDGVHGPG